MRHLLYHIRLLVAQVDGTLRLLVGEAVSEHGRPASPPQVRPLNIPLPQAIMVEGVVSVADLSTIVQGLSQRHVVVAGITIATGPLVKRPSVLLAPIHTGEPNPGPSLHPNLRFTYELAEWWDAEEKTFNTLWATRQFAAVGQDVETETGLALHQLSDRVGNFFIFDRLSPWRLDYAPDHLTNEH